MRRNSAGKDMVQGMHEDQGLRTEEGGKRLDAMGGEGTTEDDMAED